MRNGLIILATGRDRPGIVDRIAGLVHEAACNIEDSRMAILGGEFALIALVTGRGDDLDKVKAAMPSLAREIELTLQLKDTVTGGEVRKACEPLILYKIRAVCLDHPGVVHKFTHVLAAHRVNVARLDTFLSNAPVTGTPVFSLQIEAEVPAAVAISTLRSELLKVAEAENIDLEIRAAD